MSFDQMLFKNLIFLFCLNPFRTGRCLSTERYQEQRTLEMSQSLSNRAMSFDAVLLQQSLQALVSIPFEQGDVFRQRKRQNDYFICVSIPFEQGDVFRL